MKKILLIEDEKVVRETISEILQLSDYEVIKAENGKVGLEKAIGYYPDLVLCDVMMPKMNGIDTITAFRNHPALKYVPFIFLSALSEMSDIRRGMNLGAEDYLTKPFKTKELLSVIDLQLNKVDDNEKLSEAVSDYRIEKVIEELKVKANENEQKWQDCLESAGRIQNVILPKKEEISNIFPNNFNYYRSKYCVSGDFYWAQNLEKVKLIAVADCTGHGIPASLLTICCYNGLNIAVKHFGLKNPKEILEKVNALVLEFMQEHNRNHYDMGMDISLCSINKETNEIKYAGARRPLFVIAKDFEVSGESKVKKYKQKKGNPLYKIKGSLYTIGSTNERTKLEEHLFKYNPGDQIYLSSDGYADQFGGYKDKRFGSKNLIQLLLSIQKESMSEQEKIVAQTLSLWKGETEQTDDITLLGIEL